MKRFFLFILVNVLVVATLSITWSILDHYFHFGYYITSHGINYQSLMILCFVWGMGGAFISLMLSKFFAKTFMGVKIIDSDAPQKFQFIVDITHELATRAGLRKMPEVGFYTSPDMNAFATGPSKNKSLVAVSTGLVENMSREEIEGVIGHEITHITNGDMVTMTLIQGVINAFTMFLARVVAITLMRRGDDDGPAFGGFGYYMLVFALDIFFSILGSFVTAAFSRAREFRADAGSAKLTSAQTMINSLRSLERHYNPQFEQEDQKAVATLKISGHSKGVLSLLATHPPISERIKKLEKMF